MFSIGYRGTGFISLLDVLEVVLSLFLVTMTIAVVFVLGWRYVCDRCLMVKIYSLIGTIKKSCDKINETSK